MSNAVITTINKSVGQPGMAPVNNNYTLSGIQNPPLETTINYGSPITISNGIGVLFYAALQMLYLLSDQLDATVKFYSATAGGGSLIATINLVAGVAYEWDTNNGTNPLGTTNALSMVITAANTAGGVSSGLTATNVHARTSLSA
jgi:hypothetical protein